MKMKRKKTVKRNQKNPKMWPGFQKCVSRWLSSRRER